MLVELSESAFGDRIQLHRQKRSLSQHVIVKMNLSEQKYCL